MTASLFIDRGAGAPERRYRRLIDAHFACRSSPAEEQVLRRHLVTCGRCRAYYDRHLSLERIDAGQRHSMSDRLASGLGLSRGPRLSRRPWSIAVATAALAACALLLVTGGRRPSNPQARGARPGSQLLAYELARGRAPRPVGADLRTDSGLAFAYANIGHKQRLMIFAVDVDDGRRVYWYHPAWTRSAENPIALAIEGDEALHEIPQAVTHHFAGRRVQLFGVFLDHALSARDMEDLVAKAPVDQRQHLQLDISGADVTRLDLALAPAP